LISPTKARVKANKAFIVQASLTIVNYVCKNIFVAQEFFCLFSDAIYLYYIRKADCGFENKQKWKKVYKCSPLLTILPEGPQKKFL